MKIEQIAPDKVRVTLSEEDLVDMKIDPTCFLSDTAALNGFIIDLMHEIYRKTDFNPYQGNITMEAQPEIEGMTIMLSKVDFTPRVDKMKGIAEITKTVIPGKKRKIKGVKALKASEKPKLMQTFTFNDFDNVSGALVRMSSDALLSSGLYRTEDGYAILVPANSQCLDDIAMIMEFADEVKRGYVFEHIKEHGECIADGEKLLNMANGIKSIS